MTWSDQWSISAAFSDGQDSGLTSVSVCSLQSSFFATEQPSEAKKLGAFTSVRPYFLGECLKATGVSPSKLSPGYNIGVAPSNTCEIFPPGG